MDIKKIVEKSRAILSHPFNQLLLAVGVTCLCAIVISLFNWPTFAESPPLFTLYCLLLLGLAIPLLFAFLYFVPFVVSYIPKEYRRRTAAVMAVIYLLVAMFLVVGRQLEYIIPLMQGGFFLGSLLFYMYLAVNMPITLPGRALRLLSRVLFLGQLAFYWVIFMSSLGGRG